MRILLFTGSRLRHWALAAKLADMGSVVVISEAPKAAAPMGPAMRECAKRMDAAEAVVFPRVYLDAPITVVPFGELEFTGEIRAFNRVVVFGSSWIRGPLLEKLQAAGAMNLHMGVAPEYRGTACNFWAEYDERPELVGATIHRLTATIDGGPILTRVTGRRTPGVDPWEYGMRMVEAGHDAMVRILDRPHILAEPQDRSKTLRYSRSAEYTEDVCARYLTRLGIPF